jgi:hypothetical protein
MTARFRPASSSAPRRLRINSGPPPGVRASVYYRRLLMVVPKTTAVLVTVNILRLVRDDLGSLEAAGEWLADVVKQRGAPVLAHINGRTLAVGPGTREQLLGHIGVHHELLEAEFGAIERVA